MNSYKILLLICQITFFSCSQSNEQLKLNCESISSLMERDQALRKTKLKGQFFSNVDSIMKSKGFHKGLEEISNLGELKDEVWQEAHDLVIPFSDKQKAIRDSFRRIQNKIDSLNTIEVITQIETFGIDSLNRIDEKCDQNSLVVFLHCPETMKEKVRSIINSNKEKIGNNRMRHIGWHLDGRN